MKAPSGAVSPSIGNFFGNISNEILSTLGLETDASEIRPCGVHCAAGCYTVFVCLLYTSMFIFLFLVSSRKAELVVCSRNAYVLIRSVSYE